VAHVDAPRIDLKQIPLYEDSELAYFKTHYYGGIKKYQWTAIPLELRGVVALSDGSVVDVVIGNGRDDPQFVITDLLPHLSSDQMKKSLSEAFTGECLNILIGSVPDSEEGSDRVKLAVLAMLKEKYGITEDDFLSAELCAVPAFGGEGPWLDRSMIGGYGHDDRVFAYAAFRAILETEVPQKTAVSFWRTRRRSAARASAACRAKPFECFMEDLCMSQRARLRHCFESSICLSADVCNAYDPNFSRGLREKEQLKTELPG
jgi:aspartyl aminopeptidase